MQDDEAYQAVLKALGDMATEWRIYRDTVNRAISLLNHEVIALTLRFDIDDGNRTLRQSLIDAKIETIVAGQEQIRRWQWIRISLEVSAMLVIAAFVLGLSR